MKGVALVVAPFFIRHKENVSSLLFYFDCIVSFYNQSEM
jgi:hypothetical protein